MADETAEGFARGASVMVGLLVDHLHSLGVMDGAAFADELRATADRAETEGADEPRVTTRNRITTGPGLNTTMLRFVADGLSGKDG